MGVKGGNVSEQVRTGVCEGGPALKPADIRENKMRFCSGGGQHLGQESNVKTYNFISEADLSGQRVRSPLAPRGGGGGG